MKKSGILFSMIAVMILAGGYAVRDSWLPGVVGEEIAQMSPTELMADLFNSTPESENATAPDVLPPENTEPATEGAPKNMLPEQSAGAIVIPEDRIELITPIEETTEPEITLDELLENSEEGTLPSTGPRKMPRPSAQ